MAPAAPILVSQSLRVLRAGGFLHPSTFDISQLLVQWNAGNRDALDQVMPLVYERLRELARARLRAARGEHSLQTTSLVHDAWLRLATGGSRAVVDRGHFLALASHVMRHILVDHARARVARKRGGGVERLPLDDELWVAGEDAERFMALDEALTRFAVFDARRSLMVEQRYFGGLSLEEVAEASGVSLATAKRDLRVARAWLAAELRDEGHA